MINKKKAEIEDNEEVSLRPDTKEEVIEKVSKIESPESYKIPSTTIEGKTFFYSFEASDGGWKSDIALETLIKEVTEEEAQAMGVRGSKVLSTEKSNENVILYSKPYTLKDERISFLLKGDPQANAFLGLYDYTGSLITKIKPKSSDKFSYHSINLKSWNERRLFFALVDKSESSSIELDALDFCGKPTTMRQVLTKIKTPKKTPEKQPEVDPDKKPDNNNNLPNIAQGLAHYFKFNEASGNKTQDKVDNSEYSIKNLPSWKTGLGKSTGLAVVNNAYLELPNGFFDFEKPFSISQWQIFLKPGQSQNLDNREILGNWKHNTQEGFYLAYRSGFFVVTVGKSSSELIKLKFPAPLKTNGWYHLALTYDGKLKPSSFNIFINGNQLKRVVSNNNLKETVKTTQSIKTKNNLNYV